MGSSPRGRKESDATEQMSTDAARPLRRPRQNTVRTTSGAPQGAQGLQSTETWLRVMIHQTVDTAVTQETQI